MSNSAPDSGPFNATTWAMVPSGSTVMTRTRRMWVAPRYWPYSAPTWMWFVLMWTNVIPNWGVVNRLLLAYGGDMSTNTTPDTITLTDGIPAGFTYDARPNAELVADLTASADAAACGTLIPAPYTDPRMADIVRYAVVVTDVDGNNHTIGRVCQCGPRSWELFTADASHSFGRFRNPQVAAGYAAWTIEWQG